MRDETTAVLPLRRIIRRFRAQRTARPGLPGRRADQPVPARPRHRAAAAGGRHPGGDRRVPRQRLPGDAARAAAPICARRRRSASACSPARPRAASTSSCAPPHARPARAALRLHEGPSRAGSRSRCRSCRSATCGATSATSPASTPGAAARSAAASARSSTSRGASRATAPPTTSSSLIRANAAQGITSYFITDDNFARNKNWEAILDRIIELRHEHGLKIHLNMQVDTCCHKIPRFIEKAARAGCTKVFIGLENINPDNLEGRLEGAEPDHRVPRHAAGVAPAPGC